MSKKIALRNYNDPTVTQDQREVTGSDIDQGDGTNKRGMDVSIASESQEAAIKAKLSWVSSTTALTDIFKFYDSGSTFVRRLVVTYTDTTKTQDISGDWFETES